MNRCKRPTTFHGESACNHEKSQKICFRQNYLGSRSGMEIEFSTWTRKSQFCLIRRGRAVPTLIPSFRSIDCVKDSLSFMEFRRLRRENERFEDFGVSCSVVERFHGIVWHVAASAHDPRRERERSSEEAREEVTVTLRQRSCFRLLYESIGGNWLTVYRAPQV